MVEKASITPGFGRDLQDLVRKDRANPAYPVKGQRQPGNAFGGKIFFMLLEELRSGKSAWAVRLTATETRKQLLTIYGEKNPDSTFNIKWQGETVLAISAYATPLELKTRLEEFSFIDQGDIFVQFGNHVRAIGDKETGEFNTFRWIVKFREAFPDPGLMQPAQTTGNIWPGVEETELEDSYDLIKVKSGIPVGLDIAGNSPMVAGAIGIASFIQGEDRPYGWAVDAIEARHLLGDTTIEVQY